jgi:O-antigen/teichoic acid export membrane protein
VEQRDETGDTVIDQPEVVAQCTSAAEQIGRSIATGGVLMMLGRAVVLPAGLISAAFLARVLGPADFGLYSVVMSIVVWVGTVISMLFNRASIILIAESSDWEPVAISLIQSQLLLGIAAGVALFLAAPALGSGLGEPTLEPVIRILAAFIPVSTLTGGYENVLNGRRAFRRSAFFPVVSEVSRLLLVLLLVGGGLGLKGAALAVLGASGAVLWFARRSLPLRLRQRVAMPQKRFLRYSLPLFLDTLAKRLHRRIDLWAVQALAGATAAGYYSVALSVNRVGNPFSRTLSRVILATVSDAWAQGQRDVARAILRQSLRLTLWLIPFAALGAGAAPGLIAFVFGEAYLPAAPLLVWVSFSIVALTITSLTATMLAAVGRPGAAFMYNVPLLALAVVGYLVWVPRAGAIGAAVVTAVSAWGVALAMMVAVYRSCQVGPGRGTVARTVVTGAIAYALVKVWHAPGAWVIPQLLALCGVVLLLLFVLGELTVADLRFVVSLLKPVPGPMACGGTDLSERPAVDCRGESNDEHSS